MGLKSNTLNCIDFSERGNSVEDERSPGILTASRSSPPTIHLSPSRQSSSSTDGGHGTGAGGHASAASGNSLSVAKKKRELFSARSSRSGGSNKSSDASMDLSSSKVSKSHAKIPRFWLKKQKMFFFSKKSMVLVPAQTDKEALIKVQMDLTKVVVSHFL